MKKDIEGNASKKYLITCNNKQRIGELKDNQNDFKYNE